MAARKNNTRKSVVVVADLPDTPSAGLSLRELEAGLAAKKYSWAPVRKILAARLERKTPGTAIHARTERAIARGDSGEFDLTSAFDDGSERVKAPTKAELEAQVVSARFDVLTELAGMTDAAVKKILTGVRNEIAARESA